MTPVRNIGRNNPWFSGKVWNIFASADGRSQEFAKGGTKEGVWRAEVPQRDPGEEPRWGLWESRNTCWIFDWTKYIKIQLSKNSILWKKFQLRRGTCTYAPPPPWLRHCRRRYVLQLLLLLLLFIYSCCYVIVARWCGIVRRVKRILFLLLYHIWCWE